MIFLSSLELIINCLGFFDVIDIHYFILGLQLTVRSNALVWETEACWEIKDIGHSISHHLALSWLLLHHKSLTRGAHHIFQTWRHHTYHHHGVAETRLRIITPSSCTWSHYRLIGRLLHVNWHWKCSKKSTRDHEWILLVLMRHGNRWSWHHGRHHLRHAHLLTCSLS